MAVNYIYLEISK